MKIPVLSLTLSLASQVLAGGFADSCRHYYINPFDKSYIVGTCKRRSGYEFTNSLNMNICLKDNAGQFQWARK